MEKFNPSDPKFKKVEDLPKSEQKNFVDVEGGGFVGKEAADFYEAVQIDDSISAEGIMKVLAEKEPARKAWDSLTGRQKLVILIGDKKNVLRNWLEYGFVIRQTLEEHPELRDDRELMLRMVVSGMSEAPLYASEKLRRDKWYALGAVKRNGMTLRNLPEMQDDEEVVMEAIKQRALSLSYASPRLRNNREIIVAAMTSEDGDICYLNYASDEVIEGLLDEGNAENKKILYSVMHKQQRNMEIYKDRLEELYERYAGIHLRERIEKILAQ